MSLLWMFKISRICSNNVCVGGGGGVVSNSNRMQLQNMQLYFCLWQQIVHMGEKTEKLLMF
jgi:hypothetical protein